MNYRTQERICGMLVFLMSFSLGSYNLYTAFYKGYTYPRTFLFTFPLSIIGLALIVFPSSRTERLMRGEDITSLKGFAQYTLKWRIIMAFSLVAGIVGYISIIHLFD